MVRTYFFLSEKNSVIFRHDYTCAFIKAPIRCQFSKAWIFHTNILEKFWCIKYFENPSFLVPDVRCGWEDGQTDGYKDKHYKPSSPF